MVKIMKWLLLLAILLPADVYATPFVAYKISLVLPGSRFSDSGKDLFALQARDAVPAINENGIVAVNSADGYLYTGDKFPLTAPVNLYDYNLNFLPFLSFDDSGAVYGVSLRSNPDPQAPEGNPYGLGLYRFPTLPIPAEDPSQPPTPPPPPQLVFYQGIQFGSDVVIGGLESNSVTVAPGGGSQAILAKLYNKTTNAFLGDAIFLHSASGFQLIEQAPPTGVILGEPLLKNNGWLIYKKRTITTDSAGHIENHDEVIVRHPDADHPEKQRESLQTKFGDVQLDDVCIGGADVNSLGSVVYSGTVTVDGIKQQFLLTSNYNSEGNREALILARTYSPNDPGSKDSPFTGFGYQNTGFPCQLHDFSINDAGEVVTRATTFNSNGLYKFNALGWEHIVNPRHIDEDPAHYVDTAYYAGGFNNNGEVVFRLNTPNPNHSGYPAYYARRYPGRYSVYQVIENPNLCDPRDTRNCNGQEVDLVAGKNADVIVAGLPAGVDLDKSFLSFGGTLHPLSIEPDTIGGTYHVNFQLDPVPESAAFLGKNTTMLVSIRDADDKIISERKIITRVRKTKPIRIGFVPLVNSAYGEPNANDKLTTRINGSALIKAMYPVSDADFDSFPSFLPITGSNERGDTEGDRTRLAKVLDTSEDDTRHFQRAGVSHVVGLVTTAYFDSFHLPGAYRRGESIFVKPATQVVAGWQMTLAHEFGHMFCIRFDGQKGCAMPYFDKNDPNHDAKVDAFAHREGGHFTGFSNYDFATPISIPRGLRTNLTDLMERGTDNFTTGNWLAPDEYLTIFENNLAPTTPKVLSGEGNLLISGSLSDSGAYKIDSTYILSRDRDIPSHPNGRYLAEAKDINRNVLYSARFDEDIELEGGQRSLEIKIPINSNVVYVDIYRDDGNRQGIGTVVVPSDLIGEEVKYIPDGAFTQAPNSARSAISGALAEYRQALLDRKMDVAKDLLARKVFTAIGDNLKDNFTPVTLLDAGKRELSDLAIDSMIRIDAISGPVHDPMNKFVRMSMLNSPAIGGRSKVKVEFLRNPSSAEMMFVEDLYFDGIKVTSRAVNDHIEADSLVLGQGTHLWQVRTFLVPKRSWGSLSALGESLKREKFEAESALENENDPDRRNELQAKIALLVRKTAEVGSLKADLKKEVASAVDMNFEIQ